MRRDTTERRLADAVVLHLARAILEERGPMGDERLIGELARMGLDERHVRASLARLEEGGYVAFDQHGWSAAPDALAFPFFGTTVA